MIEESPSGVALGNNADSGVGRKTILYVALREPDYSRVWIVKEALETHFTVQCIFSELRNYPLRFVSIIAQLIYFRLRRDWKRKDAVFIGFLAQPIFPLVRLLWRGPIFSDAFFSLYDTIVNDKKTATDGSAKARFARWLDRQMLSKSVASITDTEAHAEYFREEFDLPDIKVHRLWVGAQAEIFENWKPPPHDATSELRVIFWGGFIPLQGVDVIVRAAAELKGERVTFTIIGNGQTYDEIISLAKQLKTGNIDFLPWQPLTELPRLANESHLALGIFGSTDKALRVIPNKVFQALALGMPIITAASPAIAELANDDNEIMTCKHGDALSLAERILWVQDHYGDALRIGAKGRSLFYRRVSPKIIAEDVAGFVNSVLGR